MAARDGSWQQLATAHDPARFRYPPGHTLIQTFPRPASTVHIWPAGSDTAAEEVSHGSIDDVVSGWGMTHMNLL